METLPGEHIAAKEKAAVKGCFLESGANKERSET
jgi:hypothetical protein